MSNLDKINIFIPESINLILESDIRLFEIFKKDNITPNMNRFISLLISGFYNSYMDDLRRQFNNLMSLIKPLLSETVTVEEVSDKILNSVLQSSFQGKKEKKNIRLSLKPTALTENIILQIMGSREIGGYISPFLCAMITEYCSKPLDARERILFSESYNFISNACHNNQAISFSTTWNPTYLHTVIPYKVVTGQGEMFNYLLCQERDPITSKPFAKTYRLNRISKPNNSSPDVMDPTIIERLERMNIYGAQYIINDDEEACVLLSNSGIRLYNRIYYGRPIFSRIERTENGAKYYFQCSKDQLLFYFRRFSNGDAIILSPNSLRIDMMNFHKRALEAYSYNYNEVFSNDYSSELP